MRGAGEQGGAEKDMEGAREEHTEQLGMIGVAGGTAVITDLPV